MVLKSHFRVHVVGPVCRLVAERGGSIESLLRRSLMPAEAHRLPHVDVPLVTLHRFHEEAERASREPLLGLLVGERLPDTTWDVIQLCCRSARTLGEALSRLPALIGLFNAYVEITVQSGREWTVDHRIPGEPLGLSRHGNELWIAALLTQVARVTGRRVRPTRVWFAHPRPRVSADVARRLGVERILWSAGSSGISLTAEDCATPLVTSDPVMFQVLERLSSEVLRTRSPKKGLTALVYGVLREALNGRVPGVGQIARALALSERSLQRGLCDEGTTYRELVDQVRRDLAREDAARDVPAPETADRLGYADVASFRRAMARWRAGLAEP